jgi:type II secretory pathway pseudopilin PulG
MNWETVGIVSTLIASIATLLTLFYLAMQVRESNKLARSSSLLAVLDGFTNNDVNQGFQYPELIDISIRGYRNWENLPVREKSKFDGLMTQKLLHMQKIHLYHDNGLIDDGNYSAWLAHTAGMIKTPGGQQWWRHARSIMAPDVIIAVDQYLANNPEARSFMDTYSYQFEPD